MADHLGRGLGRDRELPLDGGPVRAARVKSGDTGTPTPQVEFTSGVKDPTKVPPAPW
ncbi:hypothetical protein [Streptomyces sp. 142MFCol3.1]|uniref:hypothetical protein n=1 Tax=Streptomyces sp. 142MFCol3.1 TaxID=1172179 RepID=UPI002277381D|nr:hypothetical protein [Streptomyces sp. 142MFCol3.1]